ncbi:MAG: hypothetical protein MK078_15225 [Crocinitomicaceae bacterium]|nr:hypothetical protein [Crocinitomicaceae bacterium]
MLKNIYIALFSGLILCSLGCRKSVSEVNLDYQGTWQSEPINISPGVFVEKVLVISDSQAVFGEYCDLSPTFSNCSEVFEGEAKINRTEKKIFVGPWKKQVVLRIDDPPHINQSGEWECTLTSTKYIKE